MDHAPELCILTGQLFGMVLVGELDVNSDGGLADLVQQLILKTGDKHAAAQNQGLILCGSAGKLLAVAETCVIQHHLVTGLGGAILDHRDPGCLLLQPLDLTIHLCVSDDMLLILGLQAPICKFHWKQLLR